MDFHEHRFYMSIIWEQSVLYFTKVSTFCYFASERVTTLTTTKCPVYHIEDTGCTIRNYSIGLSLRKTPEKFSKFREAVMQVSVRPVFTIIYSQDKDLQHS